MVKKLSKFSESQVKRQKLIEFANELVWSSISKTILIKKDLWDFVFIRP